MPAPDFVIKLGDKLSALQRTLVDEDGNPVDIGGATVEFHARLMGGTPLIDAAAQNLQSGATTNVGLVQYNWGTVPLESGIWLGEFEVTFISGNKQTFPNSGHMIIRVPEQIA